MTATAGAPGRAALDARLDAELGELKRAGTYKFLRTIEGATGPLVQVTDDGHAREVLLLCSNNYLGLAQHPDVIAAGIRGLERHGAGTASVRFICGTFAVHHGLETALADLLGTEAALTYVSAWNANEAVVPTLVGEGDVILSDELNHASIIDAGRLTRGAQRLIYKHGDMDDLAAKLKDAAGTRTRLIITDGVFSMEGDLAKLPEICDLADRHRAVIMMDDSHGTGVLGKAGRGTAEHFGVLDRIDITTSTLGKALGGAAGGFVASSKAVVEYLVQRSRPQLFSNALPPTVASSALEAVRILQREPERVQRLRENAEYFRERLRDLGYQPLESDSAIVPIIVGETATALRLSQKLYDMGVFVIGFGFPVVPEGAARLRVQLSAAHTREHLDHALAAFESLRLELPQN
ncbi:MAG TPA: glycine C-acetyltransferase [Chloroflexota bacterium]|nr:glycine C-acetyltransferase [Chloroflexota bacterium]